MNRFLAGLITGFLVIALAAYFFVVSGGMPVATQGNALPFEKWVARASIHAATQKDRDVASPISASEANLVAGARIYAKDCAGCHGVPEHPSPMKKAMYPNVPQLFEGRQMVTDDPVGTIHWKIHNGIRLTGMPAFADLLNDTEQWQVTLALKNADHLPEPARSELKQPR